MRQIFQANYLVTTLIVILLLLIVTSIAVVLLRRLRFIQKPLVLVGDDEALVSAGFLVAMLLLCTGVVPGIFHSATVYYQNTAAWMRPFLMMVAELSGIMLVFQLFLFLLIKLGLLLIGGKFTARSAAENGAAVSYWIIGIAIASSYVLRSLLLLIADDRVPRLIRMTY